MRLKKLILHGFKSFADRTEFVFDAPITGIVGPNGCGKSNVVDGFKWVLGEQSAKSLRGEAMLDVIFNGSGARKPGGMAEVVLVFENPQREDGTRILNLDADEVSVGRRLYRDGTSEYTLNNQSSRLKDIRELFLDTGVGVDAYSVIEQGRVSQLLDSNPAERRLIFEEAAGISKFKQRKKEAQRKLEKVDQNLLRVTDIVDEVEKRLRSVKVQAGKARNYQEHSTRLRELRLTYSLKEYHTQAEQLKDLDAKREDAQFRLDDLAGDLQHKQNELAENREKFDLVSQSRQKAEYELVQAKAAMQSAQQRQQYAEQQLGQIAEQTESFEQDRAAAEEKLAEVSESLANETDNLQTLTQELQEHRRLIEQRQIAFRDGQLALNQINKEIEQHKQAILDLMRRLANTNSRLGAIEIERKNIAAQQNRIGERRRIVVAEVEALDAQRAQHQERLDAILAQIQDQQGQLEETKHEAQALGRQISEISEQLGAAKEHRSGLLSRQKLLKDLEAKREGMSEGVKSVLRQRDGKFSFIKGVVADVLRVDVEHAHAIEAALDGRDQLLIAADSSALFSATEALDDLEGRVNILPASSLTESNSADSYDWNQHSHLLRLAIDLVKFAPEDAAIANHLLGRTAVVDDLAIAADLHRNGPKDWRYVTTGGDVLEADGTLRAGPLTAAMGLISRRSELEAIAIQIGEMDGRIEELAGHIAAGNTQARALEETQNTLRNAVYQSNTQKVELTSQIAQVNDKQSALRREQPVLERELQGLMDHAGKLTTEEQQLAEKKAQMETEQSDRQRAVEELGQKQIQTDADLKQWAEQLTSTRVELGQIQEKQLSAQQHVQRMTGAKSELQQQIQRIISSAEGLAKRQATVEHELAQARDAEESLVERQGALTEQVQELADRVKEFGEAVQVLTRDVEKGRNSVSEIEQQLHQVQLQLSELRVRQETLVNRTREELELDLPAKYAEYTAPLEDGTAGPGYQPADMDWEAVAVEIKELRDKIQRLGNVNLDAISEQDELEQRSTFLTTQVTDLTSSKKQLEELIETINQESSIRFQQTFETVREHFQGMFRKLFGGGKADIYLELEPDDEGDLPTTLGPDGQTMLPIRKKIDVLDAGIEIMAHPPGKKPATISQLSGGEKTMTCIALLMSIFKSKPSPFCILDEVDAALDEANNQRFNLIVQDFVQMSQFIVITHSKRTMQIADILYGVTMQEQGVSKRVAVKFDQVDNQGRINQEAEEYAAA
ncbi:MAG TPA: chromosome segregation protein SMC [Tepidisphaeraceae bacterium]|jgi:chromosome segregation protein|nr:chromosome segregation protein SMC [Tepidisphaeraceae bacterium]